MGISVFGHSDNDLPSDRGLPGAFNNDLQMTPRQPKADPLKFTIEKMIPSASGDYVLVKVFYPQAVNFHGRKVMILQCTQEDVRGLKRLDPHFLEEGGSVQVVARFRPTDLGWHLGLKMIAKM